MLLIIALIIPENLNPAYAADVYEDCLGGWKVDCYWSDITYDYVWDSSVDEYRRPKLIFTYRLESSVRDYAPGSIKVGIPGIGSADRTAIKPAAGLPTEDEDSEWDVIWDQDRDIYTFTNRFEVKEGESVNGGFEIIWELKSRDTENGYEQKRSPTFTVDSEGSITLRPLGFSFTSTRDRYVLAATADSLSSSVSGLADDHVWYEISTDFDKKWLARGLYSSSCRVNVTIPDDLSADDIILLSSSGEGMNVTENPDGELEFYLFKDRKGNLGSESYMFSQSFIIGFDREKTEGQKVTVREHLDRLYLDESEWIKEALEDEVVDTDLDFFLQSYDFGYNGLIYDHDLWNEKYENFNRPPDYYWYGNGDEYSHMEPPEYDQRLCATDLYNGTVVEFTLRGSAAKDFAPSDLPRLCASPSDMALYEASPSEMEYIFLNDTASPSVLRAAVSDGYSLVLGDDKLAVYLKDGSIRPLDDEEYDLDYVRVPSGEEGYEYEIYGASSADLPFEGYRLLKSSDMSAGRMFALPRGIKAVFVRINGIKGNFETDIKLGVRLNLDWQKEQEKREEIRIDHENRLVNFSFFRALSLDGQNVERNDCVVTAGDYGGTYGEELAARDMDLYGEYLLRDYSNVWLRDSAVTLKAGVSLASFESNREDGYLSRVVANGTITADEPGELTRFSLYTVLPDGLRGDFYSGPITVKGSLTAIDGSIIDEPSDYVSFSEGSYNGKKMLQADFDFRDRPLNAEASNWVRIHFPVSLSFADAALGLDSCTVTVYLLIHDEGLGRVIGPAVTNDEYDIDKNGVTTEKMAYASVKKAIRENADEWREFAYKSVKSDYSDGYVAQSAVRLFRPDESEEENAGSFYEYRLSFGLGSSAAKDIVFFDHLERGEEWYEERSGKDRDMLKSGWQGEFCSVDTEYAKDQGLRPTVYYSVNADEPFDLSSPGWSRRLPSDKSDVKSIAVKLDTSALQSGLMKAADVTCVTVKMRAPADLSLTGKKALNQFVVSYSSFGANGGYEDEVRLPSAVTTLTLLESVGKVVLQKVDADNLIRIDTEGKKHYAALTGAEFMVYDEKGEPLFLSPVSLDSLGRLVIENVTQGLYYWEEVKAPEGYERIPGRWPVMIEGVGEVIDIENYRLGASVTLRKHDQDADGDTLLPGAVFELAKSNGEKVFTDAAYNYDEEGENCTFITGDDGSFTVTSLPWGSYVFEEVKAPAGYELSSVPVSFNVGKSSYDAEAKSIHVSLDVYDEERTASIYLTKTDAVSGEGIDGAVYGLYRCGEGDGEDVCVASGLKSGQDGLIEADGLKFGTYYFKETLNPGGYILPENEAAMSEMVILNADTAGSVIGITHADERKSGRVILRKCDDTGRLITGAVFELYAITDNGDELLLGSYVTGGDKESDDYDPRIQVDDLEWGDYYFIEKDVPEGYQLSKEKIPFTVDRQSVQNTIELEAVNDRQKGSVRIKKVDRNDPAKGLGNASFALYFADGTPCVAGVDYQLPEGADSITTGDDGCMTLTGLSQGAYYFKETAAPESYSVNDSLIRFSVTMENACILQELTVEDDKEGAVLIIDKEVDNVYEAFGNPVFIFKITRSDGQTYYTSISLTPYTLSDSVRLNVDQGYSYEIEEVSVSRYLPDKVEALKNAVADEDNFSAVADLLTEKEAEVRFYNRQEQYEKFSHTAGVLNSVKKSTQLTAVTVQYLGPDPITASLPGYDAKEERYEIPAKDIKVTLYYDDGTSETASPGDYLLTPVYADGNSDSYTGTVTAEKNGVQRTDSFTVGIDLPVPRPRSLVTFELNGGMIVPEGEISAIDTLEIRVLTGSEIKCPENDPVRENYSFTGWYLDKALEEKAEFPLTITKDMTIYAGWLPNPIEVRYAVSIYGIGADTDVDGNTSGLSLGPALGSSWLNTYRSHTPSEGQLCIHFMSWDEIIKISATNPEAFRECMQNGCTHAVDLTIKGVLAEGVDPPARFFGDGASVLDCSINERYRVWNGEGDVSYAGSDIRKVLNGGMRGVEYSLFDALPEELKSGLMSKKIVTKTWDEGLSQAEECADGLWLFSPNEIFKDSPGPDFEGKLYERQKMFLTDPSDLVGYAEDGRSRTFWLRSSPSGEKACTVTAGGTYDMAERDDICGIAFGFSLPGPIPSTRVALTLYGIRQDSYREENGEEGIAGLTFGPTLGGDYRESCISHTPYGVSKNGNAHRCIHDDDWQTIADFSLEDPYVYEQCLGDKDTPACTRGLDIFLNSSLSGKNFSFRGDGSGVLYDALSPVNRSWCYDCDWKDGAKNDGGWPASYIRAVLNGADEYTNRLCDGSAAITTETKKPVAGEHPPGEKESLFGCLPSALREHIVPKSVISDTFYSDVDTLDHTLTTYDRLWLFSAAELYPAFGVNAVRPNEGKLYEKQVRSGISGSGDEDKMTAFGETGKKSLFLRSIDEKKNSSHKIVSSVGKMTDSTVDKNSCGIGFGFCLK